MMYAMLRFSRRGCCACARAGCDCVWLDVAFDEGEDDACCEEEGRAADELCAADRRFLVIRDSLQ
jgi:hypothetical protein